MAEPRLATYARHYDSPPQMEEGPGASTWLTRGANFVVAVSKVKAGARLTRSNNTDEYVLLLPHVGATVEAGGERIEAAAETLVIVPPGASTVTARADGLVVRVFSKLATDLVDRAPNGANYADGAPEVAPLVTWPEPVGGYRLRSYRLADYLKPGSNMRIFRTRHLMVNVLGKRDVPRDVRKLSPHTHADFEQGSLAVQGTYVHHLRWPWTPDMTTWRDDEHVEMASPSLLVVPPKVVHTSMNIAPDSWLIDIFAPPRVDFSSKPGLVCNADEYPTPPDMVPVTGGE